MKTLKVLSIATIIGILMSLNPYSAEAQVVTNQGGNTGIGLMAGEPSGVTLKTWNSDRTAFDLGLAWSFFTDTEEAIQVLADYQMHSWFNDNPDAARLGFYYGLGGRVIFTEDVNLGVRTPLGLNLVFNEVPVGLFVEGAPVLEVTPETELEFNAVAGIRYYF
jgi:hypothetical protein